jgi:SAM-dependent methyltransferase
MNRLKAALRQIFLFAINNVVVNNMLIQVRLEKTMKRFTNPYLRIKVDERKNLQETAGFSLLPDINEALEKFHTEVRLAARTYFPSGCRVLDIGCGPGLYLRDFDRSFQLFASDINDGMIRITRREVPAAKLYQGDFMTIPFGETYHFIYCIGMLIYISRTELDEFLHKVHSLLEPNGIFLLIYPHATSWYDLLYPDLGYIQYSPELVQCRAARFFRIIRHHHAIDNRSLGSYDRNPYSSRNPHTKRTIKNSCLMLAQKQ